jgi:predicted phosphodiesterase
MDYITVFGDIHGNLAALEAVWADMEARGLQNRYCLGDLVGYGTFPNEVVDFIRGHEVPCLMGNYDQGVGNSSDDCGCAYTNPVAEALGKRSIAWSNAHTREDNKAYLRDLPAHIPLSLTGGEILLVHGSPRKVNEYLFQDRPAESLERIFEGLPQGALVCGHTHLPYHRVLPSGRVVINAGSVGKPKDKDPRAGYVLITWVGGDLKSEFIRVAYDIERTAQAIEASDMPHEYAQMLRDGAG